MSKKMPYEECNFLNFTDAMISDGKYLEALIIVSSYIEIFLGEIVAAASYIQAKKAGWSKKEIIDFVNSNTLAANIKAAICLGMINKKLYNDLQSFKSERNNMVHDFMKLRRKTVKHLESVINRGKNIYIEILKIRQSVLPKAIFGD